MLFQTVSTPTNILMEKMKTRPEVVVWLPTLNEALCVREMVVQIHELGFKVFITDAGSTDGTLDICKDMGIKVFSRPGKGKGYGILQAMAESEKMGYKKMVFIDCDRTYPVSAIPIMVNFSTEYLQVIAVRDYKKIVFLNRMANILLTGCINFLFGSKLSDTQSGLRLIDIQSYKGINRVEGFDIETELTCYALKSNHPIKQVPIDYFPRSGKSKSGIKDAFIILLRIIRCRFF